MNNDAPLGGRLITCPDCEAQGLSQPLGSITAQGYLVIQRSGMRYTVIKSPAMDIICKCGYSYTLINSNAGKVPYLLKQN